jgi:A/G-specific adenine glycosylase
MRRDREIARAVVAHYAGARRDLPWRRTRDPYAIWVSEIMLQQTRVATVIPYWERWMARFPTVAALAGAPLDDVLAAWAGLGYYSRARNLHAGARAACERWSGALPRRAAELREVPGIGPYTAGAIASIAFGERAPLVDGNVARVLARVFAVEHDIKSTAGQKALWRRAGELMEALPEGAAPGDLNQGLMELGASLCAPAAPRCLACPLAALCDACRTGRQDALPIAAPRKQEHELPILARTLAWIERDGRPPPSPSEAAAGDGPREVWIALARRRAGGLFGGLWELPERDAVLALGGTVEAEPVAHHEQTLTHRRLRVTVVRGSLPRTGPTSLVGAGDPGYDAFRWTSVAGAGTLGVAAATTAILRTYQDSPWTSIPRRSPSSPRVTRRSSKASATSGSISRTPTSPRPPRARRRASTSSSTISGK